MIYSEMKLVRGLVAFSPTCCLTGHYSCWPDDCQEVGGEGHSTIYEAAQAVAGQAGEAGDQLGYATERLIRMGIS